MDSTKRPSSYLDKRFDRLRDQDYSSLNQQNKSSRALKKLQSNRLAVIGIIFSLTIILSSIFAPLITKYDPQKVDLRSMLKPPSSEHILGTDKIGRDVFARIIYGGRISILVGLGSALGAALIGVSIGAYTAYRGGWWDSIFLRISEIFMAFPQIILVLLLVSVLGQSLMNLIIIFVITGWGGLYRMTRAQVLSLREEEYVQALRAFGLSRARICFKHILPNALGPIMVNITLSTAMFILEEAALSFLGLGVLLTFPLGEIFLMWLRIFVFFKTIGGYGYLQV